MSDENLQKTVTLPKEEARSLLVELMHKGFDATSSPVDKDGNITVTWPASTNIGKQL